MYESEMRARKAAAQPPPHPSTLPQQHHPSTVAQQQYAAAAAAAPLLGPLPSARRVPAITNPSIMDAGRRTKQNELRESLDQQVSEMKGKCGNEA